MMVSSPGLSIDTRSTHLNPLPTSTQLSHHTSRERMLSVSSSTSSLSSEHSYHTFQRGSIDLRTKLAYSPSQPPRSPNSPAQTKDRTEGDSPSGRYMISPRLAPSLLPKSPSQAHQPSPSSPTGSLRGFPAGHQPGHVRRRDGSASSLTMPFDPYRSRQSPPPNKRASKNDQQGQQPHKQHQQRQGHGGYGSDDGYEQYPHIVEGGILSDDQAFAMLHNHGSVHSSPTSASLMYHGSPSMAQPHLPHSPHQAPLEGHHGYSRAMSPSPHMAHVDPYRSAYSQQQLYQYQQQHVQQQQQQQQQQPYSSYQTHLASHGSSPMMPYDDLSSSYDSRYSGQSSQFPMYPLSPQNSNQALTAAYHHQQQLHQAHRDSSIDLAGVVGRPNSRQSMTLLTPQPMRAGSGSKTTSSSTASRRLQSEEEEEEENAEILQKVSQSGTRSGMTLASSQSTGKNSKKFKRGTNEPKSDIDDDDDEEEGQEKGANRQRDGKRCWCCSRRLCVYMSFLFLLVLAVAMFFVLPRSPGISFVAVVPDGDPVFSRGRIQESFTLQMRVDSSENYLPIKLSSVEMTVWWKMDMTKIGTNEGLPSSVTIHPKVVQTISMPMAFDYQSLRIDTSTDGVLQALIKACTPLPPGSTTPPDQLNLTFGGKMKVWGLSWAWKPEFSFNVGTACPSNTKEQETVPVALPPPPPTTPTGATPSTGTGSSPATPSGTRGTTPSGGNSVATPTPSARS